MLIRLRMVTNLNKTKPLVVQVETAPRNERAAPEQPFRLLGHCNDEVALPQNVVFGNRPAIPLRFLASFFETALLTKIARSQNDMRASAAEVLTEKGKAMLHFKQIAKFAVAPRCHRHPSKIPATLRAMVASRSRACAFKVSSSSFSVSSWVLKSSSLTTSPGVTPT
eukprot:TRINITY_DN97506_c0_g1_i1.p2 TRINITY_DN97506_c0_g1~~TRINITY_DN97506_c0_g1_i1.p2  ORF type:complete len:167 (+),score=10.66 TRINITY_DN97506_c0_g1_i1:27-527(+)